MVMAVARDALAERSGFILQLLERASVQGGETM